MNRSQSKGWRKLLGTVALRAGGLALLYLATGARDAQAYPRYKDSSGNSCVTCHSGFRGGNANALHFAHTNNLGITECNFCHPDGGGSLPVKTYTSGSGGGYGCAGCHGQDYGETSPNSNQPKATGYGLRAFHARKGVTVCDECHVPGAYGSPDPFPEMLPETSKPPYYLMAGSNLTDPCDSTQEAFTALGAEMTPDTFGLDNDGNGLPDRPLDPNCDLQLLDPICALLQLCP